MNKNSKLTQSQLALVSVFALTLALTSPAFAQCSGGVCRVPAQNSYAVRTSSPCAPCARQYASCYQTQTCGTFAPFGGFFRNLFGGCGYQCTASNGGACFSRLSGAAEPKGQLARECSACGPTVKCSGETCLADPVGREKSLDYIDAETGKKYVFVPGDESCPPAWKEVDAESCEECEGRQECEECEPCEAIETTELESRLIKVANAIRGRTRNFLTVDRNLLSWARLNSSRQASYCRLGHFTGRSFEIAGEGYATPEAAINGWLGSAPHREILLNRHFTKVGASVYRGRNGRLYWTMTFGY